MSTEWDVYEILFTVNTVDGKSYKCKTNRKYNIIDDFLKDVFKNFKLEGINLANFEQTNGELITVFMDKVCSIVFTKQS